MQQQVRAARSSSHPAVAPPPMPTFLVLRSFVLTLLALVPAAQGVKLNGPLDRRPVGTVMPYPSFSPDGKWVAYAVDDDRDNRFEFYARPSTGKPPETKLFGPVLLQPIALGNTRAAFFTDGLYSRVLDGSAPAVALDAPLPLQAGVESLGVVEERQRVLYVVDRDQDEVYELFSVPLDGSAPPVKLNEPLAPLGSVGAMQLSADRSQVAFIATPVDPAHFELFVAPIDGSQPARSLALPLVPGGSVAYFQLAANDLVVYTADQEEDERFELFVVPLDGSQAPRKLNGPLAPGGDVGEEFFGTLASFARVSPDGLRVAYNADQDGDGTAELYGVPADGGSAPQRLSPAAQGSVTPWQFTPDSERVLYLSDPAHTGAAELYGVGADGSEAPHRLNAPLVAGGGVVFVQVSLDSSTVVYLADQDHDQQFELFGVPSDGGAPPVKLNLPLPPLGDVYIDSNLLAGYALVGDEVVYEADAEVDGDFNLYVVPRTGGASRKLVDGGVRFLSPAPPGALPSQVFFMQDEQELFTMTARSARAENVHPLPRPAAASVGEFELTANGERVNFLVPDVHRGFGLESAATDERHARVELWPEGVARGPLSSPDGTQTLFVVPTGSGSALLSAASDGTSAPRGLSGGLASAGFPALAPDLVFTPDGARVLFLGATSAGPTRLYSVPSDGSEAPRDLTVALPADTAVRGAVRPSQDGARVAFLFAPTSTNANRLGIAPLDGVGDALQISLNAQSVLQDFELAPDGGALVYRVASSLARVDLYWAAADGSAAPRRLNPSLRANGGVARFAVDWATGRVVYVADLAADEQFELFSVPLDGSAPAQRLHGPLVAGGDALDFALEPGGGSVVYRADGRVDELVELFRVPVDGARAPVRLLRRPALVGSVSNFALTPDGTRVVFGARLPGGARELYSAPVRPPSGPPGLTPRGLVRLSRALVPGGNALDFRISADSSTVAFRAERDGAHHLTLLAVPIGGEQKAVEVAGPLQGGGSVDAFQLSHDGTRIVYRADQEQAFVRELFLARYARVPGR